jgi:hypothetical protein
MMESMPGDQPLPPLTERDTANSDDPLKLIETQKELAEIEKKLAEMIQENSQKKRSEIQENFQKELVEMQIQLAERHKQLAELEELQKQLAERQKQIEERDMVIAERRKQLADYRYMAFEKNSQYTALTCCPNIKLASTGLDSSQVFTPHMGCEAIPEPFGLNCALPDHALTDLKSFQSLLLIRLGNIRNLPKAFTYSNKADVARLVDLALEDAVCAFQRIACSSSGNPLQLAIRHEASLFSNKHDLLVVYESVSRAPVLVVEVEKSHNKLGESQSVWGQIHDYLHASAAFGGTHPFAVLTSFAETWVSWTKNDESDITANDVQNRFNGFNLATEEGVPVTPSPPKLVDIGNNRQDTKSQVNASAPLDRVVCKSSVMFESNQLVLVLCNAIACGLKNFNPVQRIRKLTSGDVIDQNVLSFTGNEYSWKQCRITVKGHHSAATYINTYINQVTYSAIGILGRGATSTVYHAIDSTGAECAIKMYIARYDNDEKEYLDAATFKSTARKAVKKEVANYHTIYPELRKFVYRRTLNNLQCVIMPVFLPIQTKDRLACLQNGVGDVLLEFSKKQLSYNESDWAWRHVGTLGEKVYLFDLADLENDSSERDASGMTENAKQHKEALLGNCEVSTIGDASNGMADDDDPPPSAKRIRSE